MTVYTIRQIAEQFGLTLRALRFYEQRGLFRPHRSGSVSGSQARLYTDETRARIAEVVELRRLGFTVAEILKGRITRKQYADQLELVKEQRAELDEVIAILKARLSNSR
ncbi:MerR family transcriptional regulator [Bosea sp. (in: a-proteobacteria)]|uniref:MerR family transcriptional regulator n=1 Tax=Bosea sp. (in: a-proteobacteria) TaxID=1871050 RepID=UPI002735AB57|nr:MerR family transcriptional regulator [Bosea sp. (in: a-proteobacteria)]MDP3406681.1 MerR family transcriptional regulator [Bosea sp. (in: a-proteobacteria)]